MPNPLRVAILTVSDSVSRGVRQDVSGPALRQRCESCGWQVVAAAVLADSREMLEASLRTFTASGEADLVLTTGGTGIGPRDVTPEATAAVCERLIPGLAERMRDAGLRSSARAALSRGVAGVRGSVLVVNLPGSPAGAVESFDAIADLLPHALDVLRGAGHD